MKVMVFAPHPDDEILGCGGTLAGHVEAGDSVTVVYMTSGEAGSSHIPKEQLGPIREQEALRACSLMGITDLVFLRNPDSNLSYDEDNLRLLTSLIRNRQPEYIYLPHRHDAHNDHRTTYELVVAALTRAAQPTQEDRSSPWKVSLALAYEVWTPIQQYSRVVDITPYIDKKIAALSLHRSQLAELRYDEAVRSLNRYRGIMTGEGDYCECFQIL
ncbi:MAG: PIG-L family deacetylase [Syntrophomonadaceae bacterium]|nr:PIG-L family deacetylase [Syntrophomonadaceae bacterium]